MATLCLDPELEHCACRELHDWLGGDWAVLLSNPEDFQQLGRQKGQWLAAMRRQFGVRALHALALKRDTGPPQSITSGTVWLREPPFAAADPLSFAARALRGELLTARSRFVMFIDGSLKRRAMLKYSASASGSAVPAAELLAAVDALRGQRVIGKAA